MAYTPEQAMHRALNSFGQGVGQSGRTVVVSQEAIDALYLRYSSWVGVVKPGRDRTPLQVWGDPQIDFDGRFRLIGRRAAELSVSGEVGATEFLQAAVAVESESDCPYCP